MQRALRVVVLIEPFWAFSRSIYAGISAYSRTHGPWNFYYGQQPQLAARTRSPRKGTLESPDGCIVRMFAPLVREVRRLGVPTVNVLSENLLPSIPRVVPDNRLLAQAAADHLWDRGLRNFAFVGIRGLRFSDERREHFVAALSRRGQTVQVFEEGRSQQPITLDNYRRCMQHDSRRMVEWLRELPKPVGLMTCNDARGNVVASACREAGIRVPDEIAIIGVDNDSVFCEMATPPLTSVDPNAAKIGYEAAALLERLIRGARPRSEETLVEPAGVVARQSTDVLAISNRDVAELVRYVREHACRGLTVETLSETKAVARATLDRWFRKHLGHSVSDEIARVRIARVQELLTTTAMTLADIAARSGFEHFETMYRLFKKECGKTPNQFRQAHRLAGRTEP